MEPKHEPNQGMLKALEEIEAIQQGMNPKEGRDSLDYLREARDGAMYSEPVEPKKCKSNNAIEHEVEECWVLFGAWKDKLLWYGRMVELNTGTPCEVEFSYKFVMDREEEFGDVCGFAHTHPNMPGTPSRTDHDTMHAWVASLGKSLVCAIRGINGWEAYIYDNDEDPPLESVVKRFKKYLIGTEFRT